MDTTRIFTWSACTLSEKGEEESEPVRLGMKKNESLSETSKGSGVTGTGRDTKEDIPKFSKISSAVAEGDINMKLHNWEKAESAYTRVNVH